MQCSETKGYIVKLRHVAKNQWGVSTNPVSTEQPLKIWNLDQVNPCVPTSDDLKGEESRVWCIYCEDSILAGDGVDYSITVGQGKEL